MTSAIRSILGVSMILGFVAGCDDAGTTGGTGGVIAGSGGASGTTGGASGTTGGASGTTGGASGTTGGASGTGGGASGCTISDGTGTFMTAAAGHFTSGTAQGYGFAFIAGIGAGDCTGALTAAATGVCAAGTVPADMTYGSVAGIGVNVNQTDMGEDPVAFASTVASITVNYTQNAIGTLRVQATVGGDPTTDADDKFYCYTLDNAATSETVVAADFNSMCWDGTGDPWDGVGLTSVQLIVPSSPAATPFDACLTGFTLN